MICTKNIFMINILMIGDVLILNEHDENLINVENVIENDIENYDENMDIERILDLLLTLNNNYKLLKNKNKLYKALNISNVFEELTSKVHNDIYPQNQANHWIKALRADSNSNDNDDYNDDKLNSEDNDSSDNNDNDNKHGSLRYMYCRGESRICIKACKEAYREACDIESCRDRIRRRLKRACERVCRYWFY